MQNETLMVSISGIRGIVGRGFDGFIVQKYITAFATLLIQEKKENNEQLIVLGRDSRVSGPWINPIVEGVRQSKKKKKNIEKKIVKKKKKILMGFGFKVIRAGIVTTPTVQVLVQKWKARAGIGWEKKKIKKN